MKLGDYVAQARKERGITVEYLSEVVDCSPSTIKKTEQGLTTPSFRLVAKIAKYLDIDIQVLQHVAVGEPVVPEKVVWVTGSEFNSMKESEEILLYLEGRVSRVPSSDRFIGSFHLPNIPAWDKTHYASKGKGEFSHNTLREAVTALLRSQEQ